MLHDEAGAALASEVCPYRLYKDVHSRTGLSQGAEVHECPPQPSEVSRKVDPSALQNSESLADDCHVAFVGISKRSRSRFSAGDPVNELASVASLLNRDLRNSTKRL